MSDPLDPWMDDCGDPDCQNGNYIFDADDEDTGRHGWNPCNTCNGTGRILNRQAVADVLIAAERLGETDELTIPALYDKLVALRTALSALHKRKEEG